MVGKQPVPTAPKAARLQVLCLFFALLHTSVSVVLCWVTVVPHLVQAVLDVRLNKAGVLPARQAALVVGVLATGAGACQGTGRQQQIPG